MTSAPALAQIASGVIRASNSALNAEKSLRRRHGTGCLDQPQANSGPLGGFARIVPVVSTGFPRLASSRIGTSVS